MRRTSAKDMRSFAKEMIGVSFSAEATFDMREQLQRLSTAVYMQSCEFASGQSCGIQSLTAAIRTCGELGELLRMMRAHRTHLLTVDFFCYTLRKALAAERKFSKFAGHNNEQGQQR